MPRSLSLVIALVSGALAAASCYSERPAPPAFRYACSSGSDCRSTETCIDGLCQVECTQKNAIEVCTGSDHLLCFNGVCTSGCMIDAEHCPSSQECIDLLLIGVVLPEGQSSFVSSGQPPTGLCGNFCDDTDPNSCPEGEFCALGFCVATCTDSTSCTPPLVCMDGFCVPEESETQVPETGASDSGASSSQGSSSDTGATSGGVQ